MKSHIVVLACTAMLAWAGGVHVAEAKTQKECAAEWTANKATLEASGKQRRAFISECRATDALGQKQAAKAEPKAAAPLGKDQYANEVDAKTHCADNAVVWVNLRSKVYHASTSKSYGKTKRGAYMCEKEAGPAGYRAPRARSKKKS